MSIAFGLVLGVSTEVVRIGGLWVQRPPLIPAAVDGVTVRLLTDIDLSRSPGFGRAVVTQLGNDSGWRVTVSKSADVILYDFAGFHPMIPAGTEISCSGDLTVSSATGWNVRLYGNGVTAVGAGVPGRIRLRFFDAVGYRLRRVPDRSSGLIQALILGDRNDLAIRIQEQFRRCGAMHILALSGMHLAILATVLRLILEPVIGKDASGILTGVLLVVYTFLIGPIPSLIRADIAFFVALLLGRKELGIAWPDTIFVVVLVAHLIFPQTVTEIGFILSVVSLLGMALWTEPFSQILRRWLPPPLATALAASLAAFSLSAPVSIVVFGVVYPVGILVSAPLALIATWFMWNALLLLLFVQVPGAGSLLITVSEILYEILERITALFGKFPGLYWSQTAHQPFIVLFIVVVPVIGIRWRKNLSAWKLPREP